MGPVISAAVPGQSPSRVEVLACDPADITELCSVDLVRSTLQAAGNSKDGSQR